MISDGWKTPIRWEHHKKAGSGIKSGQGTANQETGEAGFRVKPGMTKKEILRLPPQNDTQKGSIERFSNHFSGNEE